MAIAAVPLMRVTGAFDVRAPEGSSPWPVGRDEAGVRGLPWAELERGPLASEEALILRRRPRILRSRPEFLLRPALFGER